MSPTFWDAIKIDDPISGDLLRKRLRRKFPSIDPPDHRLDEIETRRDIVYIMQEKPKGDTACIGKTPVVILRKKLKKEASRWQK